MGAKIRFQRRVVFLQRTLWSGDRHFFEPRHSPLKIELEIVAERILRDVHQLGDLPMR